MSLSGLLKHLNVKPVSQQLQYPKIAFISSSPKHLGYKSAPPQQHDKTTALIIRHLWDLECSVSLRFYREDAQENNKIMPKMWKEDVLNMNQVKAGQVSFALSVARCFLFA